MAKAHIDVNLQFAVQEKCKVQEDRIRQAEEAINAARRLLAFHAGTSTALPGSIDVTRLLDAYADKWFVRSQGQEDEQ